MGRFSFSWITIGNDQVWSHPQVLRSRTARLLEGNAAGSDVNINRFPWKNISLTRWERGKWQVAGRTACPGPGFGWVTRAGFLTLVQTAAE